MKCLDASLKDFQVQIFEVDGIRGTLKELSDYFNVDPVSVSDKLAEGLSFQDALCDAKPGFKPDMKETSKFDNFIEIDEKTGILKEFLPIVKDYLDNFENGIRYIDLANKYHMSVWSIGKAIRKYKLANGITLSNTRKKKPAVEKSVSVVEPVVEKPVEKVDTLVSNTQPVSTSAVTDVQDLGDIVVITTTTTVVYRKVVK